MFFGPAMIVSSRQRACDSCARPRVPLGSRDPRRHCHINKEGDLGGSPRRPSISQRRGQDLNLRTSYPVTDLANPRFRPLSHLSGMSAHKILIDSPFYCKAAWKMTKRCAASGRVTLGSRDPWGASRPQLYFLKARVAISQNRPPPQRVARQPQFRLSDRWRRALNSATLRRIPRRER